MATVKTSLQKLNASVIVICTVGFAISYYAYYIEVAMEKDETYEAMCDISEHVSCTKVFSTAYAKGFGIIPKNSVLYTANPVYGLIFYTLVAILGLSNSYAMSAMVVTLAVCANIGTIYLATILYTLKNICVVCVSTYITNAILLILVVKKHRNLFRNGTLKKKKLR